MAERKFTLLELHMHGDAQLGPRSLPGRFGAREEREAAEEAEPVEIETPEESSGRGGGMARAVGMLVLLAVGARVVQMLRNRGQGGEGESIEVGAEAPPPSSE